MWSKLSADLLGKETQEALTANLTGALQKGKDAWQSIEQSLDVAVGHEDAILGAGTEEGLPISIPPPLPSLALLRKESVSTTAAMVEEEEQDHQEEEQEQEKKESAAPSPVPVVASNIPAPAAVDIAPTPAVDDEGKEEEEQQQRQQQQKQQQQQEQETAPLKVVSLSKKEKRKQRQKGGGSGDSSGGGSSGSLGSSSSSGTGIPLPPVAAAAEKQKGEENGCADVAPVVAPAPPASDASPAITITPPPSSSPSLSPSSQKKGEGEEEMSKDVSNSRTNNNNTNNNNNTTVKSSAPPAEVHASTPTPIQKQKKEKNPATPPDELRPSSSSCSSSTPTPTITTTDTTAATAAIAAAFTKEKDLLRTRYEGQIERLHGLLQDSEARVGLLEKEIKKAQAIYLNDDAKQKQIQALQEEGKALAFKQSEMEKAVRKARGELKGVEAARDQLAEQAEALELKVESLTELVKKKEVENSSLSQSLSAMQAVNKSSAEKLSKLEQELSRANNELATQRSALDKAWAEEKDLKRLVGEMTTHTTVTHPHSDTDSDTHTDTHTHKDTTNTTALSKGLAGIKQDFQQRESVLQATNKQLQEALTRANFEAGLREDSLRQELGEMRKRWQDAVSRTEGLAADMHESTTPLLRQIKALQEETRHKAQAWVSAEEALTERARTAEGLARTAEAGRVQVGEKVEELTAKVGELELQLSGTTRKLHETAAQFKTMEGLEAEGREKVSVLEQELKEVREAGVRQGKEGKAKEVKLKLQLQEAKDALLVVKGDLEHEQARLQMEVEALKKELALAVSKARERGEEDAAMAAGVGGGRRSSFTPRGDGGGRERESFSQSSILERTISGSLGNGGRSSSASDAGVGVGLGGGGGAGGGDVSVLALEKLQQAFHQKEAEASHLQSRLHDVERTRDALTAEVTMLGKKTSLLQGSLAAAKQLRLQVAELGQQKEVLLELLGEKTEELEVLQTEMDGLKAHFRRQLDELLSGQGQQQQHKIAV